MIDFANAKSIIIPEGEALKIARGDEILWEKQTKKYNRELLYLESTKKQWIDTGIVPNTTVDFEFKGATTVNNETGWIAGVPTWIGIHEKMGTVAITQTSSGQTYNSVNTNEVFTIGLFGNKAYFNGVETNTIARKTPYQNYTLFLFAYHHTDGNGSINSAIRLYSFKMWDNGTLVRDFIPVADLNDEPCLFDKVSEKCFYNQGTGEFAYSELK